MQTSSRRSVVPGLLLVVMLFGDGAMADAQEGRVLGVVPHGVMLDVSQMPELKPGSRVGFLQPDGSPKDGVQGWVLELGQGQAVVAVTPVGSVQDGDRVVACQAMSPDPYHEVRVALGRLRDPANQPPVQPSGDVQAIAGEIESTLAAREAALQQGACSTADHDTRIAGLSARLQEALAAGQASAPLAGGVLAPGDPPPAGEVAPAFGLEPSPATTPETPPAADAFAASAPPADPAVPGVPAEPSAGAEAAGGAGDHISKLIDLFAKVIEGSMARRQDSGAAGSAPIGDVASSSPDAGTPVGSFVPGSPPGGEVAPVAPIPAIAPSQSAPAAEASVPPGPSLPGDAAPPAAPPPAAAGPGASPPASSAAPGAVSPSQPAAPGGSPPPAAAVPAPPAAPAPTSPGVATPRPGPAPGTGRPPSAGVPGGTPTGPAGAGGSLFPVPGPGTRPAEGAIGALPRREPVLPLRPLDPVLTGKMPPERSPSPPGTGGTQSASGTSAPGPAGNRPAPAPTPPAAAQLGILPSRKIDAVPTPSLKPSPDAMAPSREPTGTRPAPPPSPLPGVQLAKPVPAVPPSRAFPAGLKPARVAGRVVNEQGQPLRGVLVVAGSATAHTTDQGVFSLADLKPGAYRITVSLKDHVTETRTVALDAGETEALNIKLRRARR